MVTADTVPRASVRPGRSLDLLSRLETASLATADEEVHELFRSCALAVLNTGGENDDARKMYDCYQNFEIDVVEESRGLKLELYNAPAEAFLDGVMIQSIRDHLFAVLRDLVFIHHQQIDRQRFDLETSEGITDSVFRVLRNAGLVRSESPPQLVLCWGGHSISRQEYDFTSEVGYQLGLRHLDIATGCGSGAMKGAMEGAAVGHAKQKKRRSRFVGITEPGIMASEPPNLIVNELVMLPDIEQRLEAFLRLAHAIVIFPGGAGTAEEILYLLGVKMQPENADLSLPVVMAAPASSAGYFEQIDSFIQSALGPEAAAHYRIIVDDPAATAQQISRGIASVRRQRGLQHASYSYNWELQIPEEFQQPFIPTHENMAALQLYRQQPAFRLASELRKAFSGIVAGNIKNSGIRAVEEHGPYLLRGEAELVKSLDKLLRVFVDQGRMKLDASSYTPCYEVQA